MILVRLSMSQHRTSSLAALGHADVDEKERSSGVGSSSADVPNAVSADGSDRMATLLELLVNRVERLEASRAAPSRSVQDRPPTPAPIPSASLSVSSASLSGPRSMSAFLSGSARRVPIAAPNVVAPSARVPITVPDSDSEDESDPTASAQTSSSAAREHPLYGPQAPAIIQDVGKAGFQAWMRTEAPKEEWTKLRNRNECEVLAQALDALVLDHDSQAAIEILARRFVGVKHADKSGNWHFADVLAKDMPKRTLLRPAVLSSVLREAKNLTLLESGGYRAGGGGRAQSDHGSRDGDRQSFRGGRGDFRSRGGRSAQPNSGGAQGGGGDRRQNTNSSNATSSSATNAATSGGSSSQGTGRGGNGQ